MSARYSYRPKLRKNSFKSEEAFLDEVYAYFQSVEENGVADVKHFFYKGELTREDTEKRRPFTESGLRVSLGISKDAFDKCCKQWPHAGSLIKDTIENQTFEGAAIGDFNAPLITRNLGLADKTESHIGGIPDAEPIEIVLTPIKSGTYLADPPSDVETRAEEG